MHNQELHDLYSSPNIVRMIKPRGIRWAEHVACFGGRGEMHTGIWLRNLRERDLLVDLGVNGRIILE
jgi:hypothetical protein